MSEQLITYIGNKRKLLQEIEECVIEIQNELGKNKTVNVDLFSGSGSVSRMLKQHSTKLISNDFEYYSFIINDCYLSNKSDFPEDEYYYYRRKLDKELETKKYVDGIISKNYSPQDETNIQYGERVFYTRENALIIDTIRTFIEEIPEHLRKYFLAPLLVEASIKTNTAGVFKGFYKDSKTGIGKFGGNGEHALSRIKAKIDLPVPVFSNYECEVINHNADANFLVTKLRNCDIVYIDPPYNQHPYGSNYFMLNIIAENVLPTQISEVSGIPSNWQRSAYNYKQTAYDTFEQLICNLDTKYAIVSYNSEGILSKEEIIEILSKSGDVSVKEVEYIVFRGGRNIKNRNKDVTEYLFILKYE